MSIGIYNCLKRERDINDKSMLSDFKTMFRSSPALRMKGQVLYPERAHLKVPGCSLVLSALLTKKLHVFVAFE